LANERLKIGILPASNLIWVKLGKVNFTSRSNEWLKAKALVDEANFSKVWQAPT
jgi:hypothetical protein